MDAAKDDDSLPDGRLPTTVEGPPGGAPIAATVSPAPARPAPVARWLDEGLRTALLRHARWDELPAPPATVISLLVLATLLALALQRLWVVGPADFNWQPLLLGWTSTGLAAWACYALLHVPEARAATAAGADAPPAPGVAQLFCLLLAQGIVLSSGYSLLWAAITHYGGGETRLSPAAGWTLWLGLWLWLALAQTVVFWRGSPRKGRALALTTLLLGVGLVESMVRQEPFWIAADASAAQPRMLQLTQEVIETQPQVFASRLGEMKPQRPGVIDLYALTFAPYAHEEVFRRESAMVAAVMAARFDAEGRSLQLLNHAETAGDWPWATPLNLRRAIAHLAGVMDRDEDILFIHLTSHGARDGELSAQFWPLTVAAVTPQQLRAWLDEAGIRYRVVSVSACYSGSWIAPLRDAGTLVMTAADASNTSYGCGRGSELTYFGRAMFDEQLRRETLSFEAAHAAARSLIADREREGGKDDGYSNPQIEVGERIRPQLDRLGLRLANAAG